MCVTVRCENLTELFCALCYRLVFLSTVMDAFNDRLMLFLPTTHIAFCNACVR